MKAADIVQQIHDRLRLVGVDPDKIEQTAPGLTELAEGWLKALDRDVAAILFQRLVRAAQGICDQATPLLGKPGHALVVAEVDRVAQAAAQTARKP